MKSTMKPITKLILPYSILSNSPFSSGLFNPQSRPATWYNDYLEKLFNIWNFT